MHAKIPVTSVLVTHEQVNLFHGRAEANGQAPRMFVRPHELEIERFSSNAHSVSARIQRIQSAGPIEVSNEQSDAITVEMTHERYRELTLKTVETVFVREAKIFATAR